MGRTMPVKLEKTRHAYFLKRIFLVLPSKMASNDSNRMMFVYFAVSGLDILNCMDMINNVERSAAIEWIYGRQMCDVGPKSGFLPSPILSNQTPHYQCGYLPMTYTALATLLTLGDDLSRVDRKSIIEGVKACQNANGCFAAMVTDSECDMRFLYCACCISTILDDWSGVDRERAIDYIVQSISYDGAMGQRPGLESHGGSTFCGVASLYMMNELYNVLSHDQIERLKRWCLMRQNDGFQGRPGKPSDTCYSYWIGATLHLLDAFDLSDSDENREFVLSTQDNAIGGFAKFYDAHSDPLHTYLGLCGLSLLSLPDLQPINAALNISNRAYAHLQEIHKKRQNQCETILH